MEKTTEREMETGRLSRKIGSKVYFPIVSRARRNGKGSYCVFGEYICCISFFVPQTLNLLPAATNMLRS